MSLRLVGYIDTDDDVEDYLSLEIPVFREGKQIYMQLIEDATYTIKNFQDVTSIKYKIYASDIEVQIGEEAIYLFKHNEEYFVGNKKKSDDFVTNKINTNNLLHFNLYSLYTFLGMREKVIKEINNILEEEEYLEFSDFVIPDEIEVRESDIVLSEQTITSYANNFFSLTEFDYSDLSETLVYNKNANFEALKLGFYIVAKRYIFNKLESLTFNLPQSDLEIRINDFIMGLLIVMKESFSARSKFWSYISEEIVKSEKYTDNDVIANIKDVEIRSSTNYYLLKPDEPVGDETFVFRSFRLEKNSNWDEPLLMVINADEEESNDLFERHIIETYTKTLVQ